MRINIIGKFPRKPIDVMQILHDAMPSSGILSL